MEKRCEPNKMVYQSYWRSLSWVKLMEEYLMKNGYTIIRKKSEDYGPDIKAEKNGITEYYEVETKSDYPFTCALDFPFETVHFLDRKKKWADSGFWYVLICTKYTRLREVSQ